MQTPDTLTFHCPSCGMKLQVPAQMAGVTGPCPQCSANITAPTAEIAREAVSNSQPTVATQPSPGPTAPQQPTQAPTPAAEHVKSGPSSVDSSPAPSKQQPEPNNGFAPRSEQFHQTEPTQPEPLSHDHVHQSEETAKPRARWMRVVFPLIFLIFAAALVIVVLESIGMVNIWGQGDKQGTLVHPDNNTPDKEILNSTDPQPAPPTDQEAESDSDQPTPIPVIQKSPEEGEFPELKSFSNPDGSPSPEVDHQPAQPATTLPATDTPPTSTTSNSPTTLPSPHKADFLANQNLRLFLEATTLDERMALMSKSQYSKEELEKSPLAGRLRPVKTIIMAETVPRLEDNLTQSLYYVTFEDPDENRQRHRIVMQVVERPGVHPPRVHADAFLQHYGKKLQSYAKNPTKDVTTFHCIAEARTADLAKDIPEDLKKSMIRLVIKSHPYADAVFDSYLSKNSPLMKHIGPRKEFPYTQPRFCTLSFRWNTKNPDKPYIELNDIVHQGWEH